MKKTYNFLELQGGHLYEVVYKELVPYKERYLFLTKDRILQFEKNLNQLNVASQLSVAESVAGKYSFCYPFVFLEQGEIQQIPTTRILTTQGVIGWLPSSWINICYDKEGRNKNQLFWEYGK